MIFELGETIILIGVIAIIISHIVIWFFEGKNDNIQAIFLFVVRTWFGFIPILAGIVFILIDFLLKTINF